MFEALLDEAAVSFHESARFLRHAVCLIKEIPIEQKSEKKLQDEQRRIESSSNRKSLWSCNQGRVIRYYERRSFIRISELLFIDRLATRELESFFLFLDFRRMFGKEFKRSQK